MGTHYVAIIDGTKYNVVGLGSTEAEAKHAVCARYRANNNAGYGFPLMDNKPVKTDAQIEEWYGIRIHGPLADGQAVQE